MADNPPYRAVVYLNLEVHPLDSNGECSGRIVSLSKLAEYSLKDRMLLKIDGFDMHDCLMKLKNKIEEFK